MRSGKAFVLVIKMYFEHELHNHSDCKYWECNQLWYS